jgi:hypothetical protein
MYPSYQRVNTRSGARKPNKNALIRTNAGCAAAPLSMAATGTWVCRRVARPNCGCPTRASSARVGVILFPIQNPPALPAAKVSSRQQSLSLTKIAIFAYYSPITPPYRRLFISLTTSLTAPKPRNRPQSPRLVGIRPGFDRDLVGIRWGLVFRYLLRMETLSRISGRKSVFRGEGE